MNLYLIKNTCFLNNKIYLLHFTKYIGENGN